MARYKVVDLSPKFLVVDLEKQLLPGSFAHAVHHLLEHDSDLSGFDTATATTPLALLPSRGDAAQGDSLCLRRRRGQQPGHRAPAPRAC